jgi:hypothetical protein
MIGETKLLTLEDPSLKLEKKEIKRKEIKVEEKQKERLRKIK